MQRVPDQPVSPSGAPPAARQLPPGVCVWLPLEGEAVVLEVNLVGAQIIERLGAWLLADVDRTRLLDAALKAVRS